MKNFENKLASDLISKFSGTSQFIITEVGPDGEPIATEVAAKKFIRQSRCIVRDHIPISFRLWKASNPSEVRDALPKREKEWCWRELKKKLHSSS